MREIQDTVSHIFLYLILSSSLGLSNSFCKNFICFDFVVYFRFQRN